MTSNFTFPFHFHALEKEMATHSSVLAWRILGTGAWWAAVYGVAQSRTRLSDLAAAAAAAGLLICLHKALLEKEVCMAFKEEV